MRKKRAIRRRVTPDPKFGDELISRFVNSVLQDGKKNIARTIVYSALDQIGQKNR
jgi:small subunit ribosomal protein S7